MVDLLLSLGKLAIGFFGILGPIALMIAFLRVCDRQESKLYTTVVKELNLPHLRGLLTVRVKSWAPWRDTVLVDLWNCSQEQVWDVIEKLSNKLPAHVRLEVNSITDCRASSTLKLMVRRTHPFFTYCPI